MESYKREFIQFLESAGVLKFGDFTAKSGRKIPYFINAGEIKTGEQISKLGDITIGLCGDLKFGRTVHSLIKAMCRYKNVKFVLIAPKELQVPDYIISDVLIPSGAEYVQVESLEDVMPTLDVLYMTRIQRERFFSEEEYLKHKDAYILDLKKLDNAKKDLTIMHPLPRVNEISTDVDDDPRAKYFEQALNGKYIRMALIMTLLKWGGNLEY